MIIGEKTDGQFEIKIPDDIAVFRMSWWSGSEQQAKVGGVWLPGGSFYIDGDRIEDATITPSQLSKGVSHAIK